MFTRIKSISCTLTALGVSLFFHSYSSSTLGGTVFFDDFTDGSVENNVPLDRSGNPVIWTPLPGVGVGTYDASSGDYILATATEVDALIASASGDNLDDTSVRAQLRVDGSPAAIAVLARGDVAQRAAYQAGISTITGNAYIVRNQAPTGEALVLAHTPTPVDVATEDALLQFDVIGNQLSMFVWRPGETKPVTPTLTLTDDVLSSGLTGVLLDTGSPGPGSAIFRFVHVADMSIPEPSTLSLTILSLLGLLRYRNRRP